MSNPSTYSCLPTVEINLNVILRDGIETGEVNVGMIQYSGTTTSDYCDDGALTRLLSVR